eukprot:scaffold196183_cov36-Tisochrysis_lutea.AAC.1
MVGFIERCRHYRYPPRNQLAVEWEPVKNRLAAEDEGLYYLRRWCWPRPPACAISNAIEIMQHPWAMR